MDERRMAVLGASTAVKWIVAAVIVVAAITIIGVALVAILAPQNNTAILQILGFSTPVIVTLLGGGLLKMAVVFDGKLSLLLQESAERARAEGKIEGLKANPRTNIGEGDI